MSTEPPADRGYRDDPDEDEPDPPATDEDCPPPPEPGCDPRLINELTCKSKGIAAQAEYNKSYQDKIVQAQVDYDTARKAYRLARHDANLTVQDLRHQIRHLIERIKCLIEQDRVIRCIERSFCEIVRELDCCPDTTGCCVDPDCDFDVDCGELDLIELTHRITRYQKHADDDQACFTSLIGEPAALTARVAAAKAEIDAINAALAADPAVTDLKKVLAEALVANRDVERVWNGFADTQAFVECLCQALTCWTKACVAISILTGEAAVLTCKQEARDAHCLHLHTNTVDEILATYDRLCPPRCEDEPKPTPPEHDCGCGCGKKHHHDKPDPEPECGCGCGKKHHPDKPDPDSAN